MIVRPILESDKDQFNKVVKHPLQSWEWGEFKRGQNTLVERIGFFEGKKLLKALQVFFHKIPHTSYSIGYYPRGIEPDDDILSVLKQIGEQHQAIAIRMEPNISVKIEEKEILKSKQKNLLDRGCKEGRRQFSKYTFILKLDPTEDELSAGMKSKTRYNVNLAIKKGVTVIENSTDAGIEEHLKILAQTTKRQGFYAHDPKYYTSMWQSLKATGIMRVFETHFEGQILASWIMFFFDDVMYYPYGASSTEHREVMASNLMMWEMIRLGKYQGFKSFDMWGALGPNPDPKDSWYGFHRFKEGYGPVLNEFLGTYDFVVNSNVYPLYRIVENLRWKALRLKAGVRKMF